jgi:hypothetical protein
MVVGNVGYLGVPLARSRATVLAALVQPHARLLGSGYPLQPPSVLVPALAALVRAQAHWAASATIPGPYAQRDLLQNERNIGF